MEYNAMEVNDAMAAGIGVGAFIVWLAFYLFFALVLAMIAKKLGKPFGSSFVMAIIPIANIILILELAEKPWWWIFLLLIPVVNFVLWIIIWWKVFERRGKPGWWCLIPIWNFIGMLIIAFGNGCCCGSSTHNA